MSDDNAYYILIVNKIKEANLGENIDPIFTSSNDLRTLKPLEIILQILKLNPSENACFAAERLRLKQDTPLEFPS